jgi:hypothetical protein
MKAIGPQSKVTINGEKLEGATDIVFNERAPVYCPRCCKRDPGCALCAAYINIGETGFCADGFHWHERHAPDTLIREPHKCSG